jgi:hypothetical protein
VDKHPAALRNWNGKIIALFPTMGEGCAIGTDTVRAFSADATGSRWGTPNITFTMKHSRPATRSECAELLRLLAEQGVGVRVLRRIPADLLHWNRPPCAQ